jgi:hypothetical protein
LDNWGVQRLHGRNPACSACHQVSKNRTFFRLGKREGQLGRQ